MAQYSVDLSINTKGYTDGIEEAKQSNAQFDSSVIKTDKSLASLKKEVGQARRAVENLAFAYAKMSKAEQQSGQGKALKRQLDEAKKYAADLKDLAEDVNNEIKNMASDTAGWDAMKQGIGVAKDGLTALATVVADVTGEEDAFKEVLLQVARIQSIANAAITIGNALQKQSALMVGIRRIQEAALKKAIDAETVATGKATIAQKLFNAVAKANPYVLLASAVIAAGAAIGTFVLLSNKATEATDKLDKEMHEASIQGQKDAQADVVKLDLLYSKTQDVNLGMDARKKAVKALQDQYPAYFGNMTTEQILLGQASDKYQQLKNDIIAVAMAKAYEQKITEKAKENVELQDQIDKNNELIKQQEKIAKDAKNNVNSQTYGTANINLSAVNADKAQAQVDRTKQKNKELQTQLDANTAAQEKYIDKINETTEAQQRLNDNTKQQKAGGSTKTTTENDTKPAVNSITELENKISDLQKKLKDGLIPEQDIEKTVNNIKSMQTRIGELKIKYGFVSETKKSPLEDLQDQLSKAKAALPFALNEEDVKAAWAKIKELEAKVEAEEVRIGVKVEPKQDTSGVKQVQKVMEDLFKPKEMNLDFSALKEKLPENLAEQVQETVDRYQEVKDAREQLTEIMNDEGASDAAIAAAQEGLEQLDEEWQKLVEDVTLYNEANQQVVKANKNMKALANTVQGVGNAVSAAAGLFSALGEASDDNQAKVLGIVAQAIATIALSFAQALTSCSTWVEWLAFGITGLATVVTMVSQIKNLNQGYARGGIIPGSSYSGDLLTAKVNSGEMILNKRQQKNLFDAIDQNKLGGVGQPQVVTVEGVIRGKDLLLVQKNYNSIGSHSGQTIQI